MPASIPPFLIPIAAVLVCLILLSLILMKLWRRASREISLVRTGAGGKRVVMDGGCIMLPFFHELHQN